MAERHPFLIFNDLFLIFCKANKNCDYSDNIQDFCQNFSLHGASLCGLHICFLYHSNTTLIDFDMAKICCAGVFAPPPKSSAQDRPLDRVKNRTEPAFQFWLIRNRNDFSEYWLWSIVTHI